MTRNKLKHFEDLHDWEHVFEPAWDEESDLAGTWGERVILELACGQGAYVLALAGREPQARVVGVDIKGARLWHGAEAARAQKLPNAKFLRTRIEDLAKHFAPGEVDEIWITFPDPHPRKSRTSKRLTSPRFLAIYERLLKPGGVVHLKTDATKLYEWTKDTVQEADWTVLRDVPDVYAAQCGPEDFLLIQTPYEKRHLADGRTIHAVSFSKCQNSSS